MRSAQAASPEPGLNVEVGFDGRFQVGRWTSIRVSSASSESLSTGSVTAVDVDGRSVVFPLAEAGDGSLKGFFQSGRIDGSIRVAAETAGKDRSEHLLTIGTQDGLTCLRQDTRLWMVIGKQVGFTRGAEQLNAARRESNAEPAVELIPATAQLIPRTADELDSLQLLVTGPANIDQQQSVAISEWVQRGGRLVLTVGSAVAAYRTCPLAQWIPAAVGEPFRERQTAALTGRVTAYVPNKGALRSLEELELSRLHADRGVVLVDGPTSPVVVRAPYGLGTVTVVAINLDQAPFVNAARQDESGQPLIWGGLPQMCLQLAAEKSSTSESISADRELQLSPTGVSDLYTQLAGILDHFPELNRASSWNVIGMLAVYLLLVGPVDYLLVHRLLKKPQLTWVTLPIWVLGASWWATTLAASDNGVDARTQQLEVLDIAADTGVQRASAWLSLYSPETRRHDYVWKPRFVEAGVPADARSRMAELARPEPGFRGTYRRGGINFGGAGYRVELGEDEAAALQVPIDQWSSLALAAEASQVVASPSQPVAECRQVTDDQGRLVVFELTHRLPGVLEDWCAVERLQVTFPVRADSPVRTLAPDVTHDFIFGTGQKLLRPYLQGEIIEENKRKSGSDFYARSEDYDPLGRDPDRLFRVLTFHDAIGGASYTRLGNQTLARLDLSPFLHLDRMVIFGRLTQPLSTFEVDGAPADPETVSTFVRLIVPVIRETVAASDAEGSSP
ncbi:MAG: hypothetical protein KDA75_11970 [Planctomycetaceae bacterium]|nr:hypothetical protein [Planctomycetaceae bacterium]